MTSAGRRQGSSIRSQTLIERPERRSGRHCSLRNPLEPKTVDPRPVNATRLAAAAPRSCAACRRTAAVQIPLGQQQPVIPRVLDQPTAGLHQPVLQARQRPTLNPVRKSRAAATSCPGCRPARSVVAVPRSPGTVTTACCGCRHAELPQKRIITEDPEGPCVTAEDGRVDPIDNRCLLNVRVLGFLMVARLPSGRTGKDPGCAGAGPAPACRLR